MMNSLLFTVWSVVCAAVASARAADDANRVLVLLDRLEGDHGKFLGHISSLGYDVTTALASSEDVVLQKIDEWQYDHLVVLGGESAFGAGVEAKKQLEFFESGRSVYLALNPSSSGKARALAKRLGADMEAKESTVIDPFDSRSSLTSPSSSTAVKAIVDAAAAEHMLPGVIDSRSDVVFMDGIGFSIAPEAIMTVGALHAAPTAFSTKDASVAAPKPANAKLGGYNLKLAALVQGRNNARAAVVGSTAMLSDAALGKHQGNEAFAKDSLEWVFGERGVLTSSDIRHKRVDADEWNPAEGYRVKDEVEVYMDMVACDKGVCGPYGGTDVQIELRMLDPYIRKTLTNMGNGTFAAKMTVPDVYGVFKFQVDYTRPGLSWVKKETVVSIRPFRHDEYARFLSQAFPYYASVVSMSIGFLVVGGTFVFGGRGDEK